MSLYGKRVKQLILNNPETKAITVGLGVWAGLGGSGLSAKEELGIPVYLDSDLFVWRCLVWDTENPPHNSEEPSWFRE